MENALTDPTAAVEILRSFPADNTNPEDDYGQCFYQYEPSGKPACIVGTFLHAVGLPLPTGGDNKEAFSNLSENYPVSDTVRILLETVQTYADGGACWGDAIEDGYLAVQKYL